ncbi:hypothetical protein BMS3Abin09_00116 [bacterium BMS3Abin09]|nr:hypothetical protein BMS3Abin09_00116 [bacterium BMS3Abin09]GBE41029.1 hypothetical protein BMS3Bbin09_00918 [bacterium BMS3Bbin09]HDO67002.1 hypothetical protein [Nitrospirota bacterium]HEW81176.1 hypothetical protein [Nitrospirota bacterium]
MRNNKTGSENRASIFLKGMVLVLALFISSCGYRVVGSTLLPFESINIKHVKNVTYEPRLEDRLHLALSREFTNQGIDVNTAGSEVTLEATVTNFELGAIGAVDEIIKEQELIMTVDIRIVDRGEITEFKSMTSPIKITFQSTGTVSDSVAHMETAIDKASSEIAKEIVGRIILKYAK